MKPSKIILIMFFLSNTNAASAQEKKVILIDAGHGGTDHGATGINGIKEKDVTLEIANAILRINKKVFNNKYDLYLTRYTDTLISLDHRTLLVRALRPDLFISLHCNHAPNEKATGIEVYLHSKTSLDTENQKASKDSGLALIEVLMNELGYKSRGLKQANFHVLRESIDICPAILVEFGFLSNDDEAAYLERGGSPSALALAVLMSIEP